jgi:cellulose synthase/poly-beta-1,6-N-acetylglucosamine synthase-like glycosyltransferase
LLDQARGGAGAATAEASRSAGLLGAPADYAFLADEVEPRALAAALAAARGGPLPAHVWLVYTGAITEARYVESLGRWLSVGLIATPDAGRAGHWPGDGTVVLDPFTAPPSALRALTEAARRAGRPVVLRARPLEGERATAGGARQDHDPTLRLQRAIGRLARLQPSLSAARPIWLWQAVTLALIAGAAIGMAAVAPETTRLLLFGALTIPFAWIALWRAAALVHIGLQGPRAVSPPAPPMPPPTGVAPSYTLLVPLYREAEVLPGLVEALSAVDYPADRLQVLLILEASDVDTRAAAARLELPAGFEIVVVPDAQPRTKPKALNYAIDEARGDLIAVYDAEDTPDPDQLAAAAALLAAAGQDVCCVQAVLAVTNHQQSWLAGQFALEYEALFDGLLPVLAGLRLPVPLGGTSNHFRRADLIAVGGWDPYNVTEDADLGIRLARHGRRVLTIAHETLEEAPARLGVWLPQRTRWLKGWMQTYAVHMRTPRRLWRELGASGFLAFQVVIGGLILSALVQPLFYGLLLWDLWDGALWTRAESQAGLLIAGLAAINIVVGYGSAIALAGLVRWRRRRRLPAGLLLTLPLYWLLISVAAYRALWQLAVAPSLWEKTPHTARPTAEARATTGPRGRPSGARRR